MWLLSYFIARNGPNASKIGPRLPSSQLSASTVGSKSTDNQSLFLAIYASTQSNQRHFEAAAGPDY